MRVEFLIGLSGIFSGSFSQIRSSLDDTMALSVASALISSRLDHLNSILYGTLLKHIARLQRI